MADYIACSDVQGRRVREKRAAITYYGEEGQAEGDAEKVVATGACR